MELTIECGKLYDRIKDAMCAKAGYKDTIPDDSWIVDANLNQTEADRPMFPNPETQDEFFSRVVLIYLTSVMRDYETQQAIMQMSTKLNSDIDVCLADVESIVLMKKASQ
jgi:hypothetical protein